MKKLKPILLAAAALGGLALMAAAALLDLPGGITGLMCGMGGALLGLGGSSVIMGAVERHMSPPGAEGAPAQRDRRAQHRHPGEGRSVQLVLDPVPAVGPLCDLSGAGGDALDPSLLRRNGPPLRLLYGQYGPLGQKAVRRKNHAHKNDRTGP